MEIVKLNRADYQGMAFTVRYRTKGFFDIETAENTFRLVYKTFDTEMEKSFEDIFFDEWLE